MKKTIIIILLSFSYLFSLEISSKEIKNGQTLLVTLDKKNIFNPKLTFDKQNINFYKHPNKSGFYALIPISYYKEKKTYRIIASYFKDNKKVFEGISVKVIDGNYESERINVSKSKVSLSDKNKKRTKKEYSQAMKIYNKSTKELLTQNKKYKLPLNTKITSSFGKKRIYNGLFKSYHSGTDFKAPVGTPIKAVNDGIVVISQNRFYAGNSIVINHGQGIYSCYFHLNKMNFLAGDKIKKGEVLGLSGKTGRVTGPHLHFSYRVHGIVVAPLKLTNLLNNNKIY